MKTTTPPMKTPTRRPFLRSVVISIALVLLSFALPPLVQAKPPRPEDRGNGNSAAENVQALNLETTGSDNTARVGISIDEKQPSPYTVTISLDNVVGPSGCNQ